MSTNPKPETRDSKLPAFRYLRAQDLRRLRHAEFSPRRPVEGQLIGRHRSRQRGYSVEFNDYREYTPGDDVGTIDWKAFGRSDRLYVKLFEHESDMTVTLVVDASGSMAYAGSTPVAAAPHKPAGSWLKSVALAARKRKDAPAPPLRKYDQACHLAAAIAFLTVKQGDRVAFAAAQTPRPQPIEPRGGMAHLHGILAAMERAAPAGRGDLVAALDALVAAVPRRGLLVLFSDLFEDREAVLRKLAVFRARGTEVIVFHVLHPDELNLPDLDDATFVDSESGARLAMNVADARELYAAKLHGFLAGWSGACKAAGYDYNLVNTKAPYAKALERYLFTRTRAS